MHVEFHDTISPRVYVDIRVIGIYHRNQRRRVDINTVIVANVDHPNQARTTNYCGRATNPIAVTRHVQVIRRSHSYRRLKGSQANPVVGAYGAGGGIVAYQNRSPVKLARDLRGVRGIGVVVPGVVGNSFWAQICEIETIDLL